MFSIWYIQIDFILFIHLLRGIANMVLIFLCWPIVLFFPLEAQIIHPSIRSFCFIHNGDSKQLKVHIHSMCAFRLNIRYVKWLLNTCTFIKLTDIMANESFRIGFEIYVIISKLLRIFALLYYCSSAWWMLSEIET